MLVLLPACGQASIEGDVGGVQRFFPAVGPPFAAATSGVEAHDRQVHTFQRGGLGGKVAAGVDCSTDPRVYALDGIRGAEQTTLRILLSNCRNGTNSAHAQSHSLMIAGYLSPQVSVNATNASSAADSLGAV